MHQSDTLGWIRVAILLVVLTFAIGYSTINAWNATRETHTTTPQETTETTPETQETTEPTCTIPTQEETTPQTEPPTTAPVPQETEKPTETAPTTNEPTSATEPPTEQAPLQTQPATAGSWRSLGTYKLTAYCPCKQCCGKDPGSPGYGITATGDTAVAGTTIAVDPNIIPYGSKVKINGHIYIAQDCGGAIKQNRLDIFFGDHQEALRFGVQWAEVFLLTESS